MLNALFISKILLLEYIENNKFLYEQSKKWRAFKMQNQISNTATLTFEYGEQSGVAVSNVATMTLRETVTVTKSCIENFYYRGDSLTYVITVSNNNNFEITNLSITDNLGAYTPDGVLENTLYIPLSCNGPAHLYVNGVFKSELTAQLNCDGALFSVASIPAGSAANIIYKVSVNDKALLEKGSTLTNTASLIFDSITVPITTSHTISVRETADVKIVKNMSPEFVVRGEEVAYNFSLYNYGNTEAVNVILTDAFSPSPVIARVSVNAQDLLFTDYSYMSGTLTIPAYGSEFTLTIPPATFAQDSLTGSVNIAPGHATVSVIGKI